MRTSTVVAIILGALLGCTLYLLKKDDEKIAFLKIDIQALEASNQLGQELTMGTTWYVVDRTTLSAEPNGKGKIIHLADAMSGMVERNHRVVVNLSKPSTPTTITGDLTKLTPLGP